MGAETTCAVTVDGKTLKAKVRLETEVLQIRGSDLKLDVPFKAMKNVGARDGVLSVAHGVSTVTLALGSAAARWVEKILRPPSRLTKLGVRTDWRAAIIGSVDQDFIDELRAAVTTLSVGRHVKEADAVFLAVANRSDLKRVSTAKSCLQPAGALWLIRPKGSAEITEGDVMTAGRTAGLVDVKVVAFSSAHSALKFVIPVKNRARQILKSSNP
jgi:hypothetical protein